MDSFSEKKAAVTSFLNSVVERVFGAEAAPEVDKKMQNLVQKQANIRAVSVRKGFQAILARSDEMAQRIEQYRRQRDNKTVNETKSSEAAAAETAEETIVMSTEVSTLHTRAAGEAH